MVGVDSLFNSTGEVGTWLSSSSTNLTGSLFISVLIILAFFFLMMLLFKMPQLLMLIIIFPLVTLLMGISEIASEMKIIVGVGILIIALGLYAFYPSK